VRSEESGIRVGIVDDHPVTRHGMAALLGGAGSITVVSVVGTPAELAAPAALDVVLLDLYLDGDRPSLDVVAELAAVTSVLVMSASRRPGDVLGAVRAGAGGYLTKHAELELITAAVATVASGGFALSPQLADLLQADLAAAPPGKPELSPREEEALDWIARGFTHAQIATRMGVAKSTVDTYVERVRGKLRVGNKAELTSAALRRRQAGESRGEPL
jgi:DNA-binding NarL/FixJ family response regulator